MRVILAVLAIACACGASGRQVRPTTGTIAGLVRDLDSGDPVAHAEIRIQARGGASQVTTSSDRGFYDLDHLAPGTYDLLAKFANQPIRIANIAVRAGAIATVDLTFTLGRPEPIDIDFGNAKDSEIRRYHPANKAGRLAIIEGTVNDTETRERVVGAVVTASTDDVTDTHQTITDDQGRFWFERLRPGTYAVSAYYSISGRGQVEVRRSGIVVGDEAVAVPLWIEMTK